MDDVNGSSPLSPCSDNSDAVNTASAKVYFGPVQSPEKKFAPLLSPCKPSTLNNDDSDPFLLRRSPRLSSPTPNESEEISREETEQEEEEEDNTAGKGVTNIWQSTPLQQFLSQDEPSSAIANRIMRAHDNPSPPPKALRPPSTTPRRTSKLVNELVFPPMDSSEESSDAVVESLLPSTTGMSLSPSPPRHILIDLPSRDHSGSPTPRRSSRRRLSATPQPEEEGDLISFDRPLSVATDVPEPIILSPSPQLATKPGQTVDDLLFPSPPCIIVQDESQISENATALINDALCIADSLLDPAPSTPPRRRSARLSALSCSPSPEPPNSTEETPRARSPRASDANQRSPRTRKRFRNGSEKAVDNNLLSPVKVEWATDSDVTDNDSDREPSPKRKKRINHSFDSRQSETNLQFTNSLSPESARILMSLASPDTKCKSSLTPDVDMDIPTTPTSENVSPFINVSDLVPREPLARPPSSAQRPPPGTFNIMNPASPVKFTLTPALDNPNRTPARRVRINPDCNAQTATDALGVIHTPVFSRPTVGDPRRTPARRIPISESQNTNIDRQFRSPVPSFLSPSKTSTLGQRAEIHETSSTAFTKSRPATFIKPNTLNKKPTVSGSDSGSDHLPPPFASTSSIKTTPSSMLPSVRRGPELTQAASRIPRIGSAPKPGTSSRTSKLPMPSQRTLNVPNALPSRLPSPVKSRGKPPGPANSSSGSDDSSSGLSLRQGAPSSGIARGIHMAAKAKHRQLTKKTSPLRPIRARLVVPGMFGGPGKKPASSQLGIPDASLPQTASPAKSTATIPQGPLKAREVVKGTLTKFELREPSSKLIESYTEARERERASVAAAETIESSTQLPITQGPSLDAFTFRCPVAQPDETVVEAERQALESGASAAPALHSVPNSDEMAVDDDEPFKTESTSKSSGSRRSSRTRKPVQADVFGTVAPIAGSSGAPRRKPGKGPPQSSAPGNIVFFINGASLKNLTNNNTTRNQHYHAELETLIVRKAGNRPESPTMKLRTIAEKQKEEQTRMRAERARRRQMGDWMSADGDSSMEVDVDSSVISQPVRHRRGPGDDEDYVTPMRPDNAGKRVKWDHGLETTVFLDEIELQPERRKIAERNVPRKSCLVVDPDRVPIDDLGNAANANAPLKLVPEKVVVTKYVYDNDLVVEEVEPLRSTRSKSKKKS